MHSILLQLVSVLIAIIIGVCISDIGLGVLGGLGSSIPTFGFGLQPTSPPINVMPMVVTIVVAASYMQAAGELGFMVRWAGKLFRKNSQRITTLSPLVTYLPTFVAGTGHAAYSVPPVVTKVTTETKIRPERPVAIAVITFQQTIAANSISTAMVALLSTLSGYGTSLMNVLMIFVPRTLLGVLVRVIYSLEVGKELGQDPECLKRVANHEFSTGHYEARGVEDQMKTALSVSIFVLATIAIVIFGSMESLRPAFIVGTEEVSTQISHIIKVLMLTISAFILLFVRTDDIEAAQGSAFSVGMQAVVVIFSIAWAGDIFIAGNMTELKGSIEHIVTQMPWLFGLILFVVSILLFSQAATVRALLPLGIALKISPYMLITLPLAVNGYFFIPSYPTIAAAINFDRTDTTRIGKHTSNHFFVMPGLIVAGVSVGLGSLFVQFIR